MVIGFYSPMCLDIVPSLLALAFHCVFKKNKKVLIINAVNDDYELELALGITDESLLHDVGLDYLFRTIKVSRITKIDIENASLSFSSQRLHVLPASSRAIKVYDKYVQRELIEIIEVAKLEYDYIFISLQSTKDIKEWGSLIHSCCNKVVINLSQNKRKSEKYIEEYKGRSESIRKGKHTNTYKKPEDEYIKNDAIVYLQEERNSPKVIYLIDKYDNKSIYNIKNFSILFPNITLGAMPYETKYYDAIYSSNVIEYMQKESVNYNKRCNSFFLKIEPVCNMILKEERRG